jgi:hypothetical protein
MRHESGKSRVRSKSRNEIPEADVFSPSPTQRRQFYLRADGPPPCRVALAPRLRRLRLLPPQISNPRGDEGHAQELGDAVATHAVQCAVRRVGNRLLELTRCQLLPIPLHFGRAPCAQLGRDVCGTRGRCCIAAARAETGTALSQHSAQGPGPRSVAMAAQYLVYHAAHCLTEEWRRGCSCSRDSCTSRAACARLRCTSAHNVGSRCILTATHACSESAGYCHREIHKHGHARHGARLCVGI